MATYLELVTDLLLYTEKVALANAQQAQIAQAVRDINDARRALWNHDDFSYKTVIKRGFVYTVQTNLSLPSRGTPLPADFLGFHQTGKVYLEAFLSRGPLKYEPYHKIIELTEGPDSQATGIPTHYGLGGPSDPASTAYQRELLLWPTPNTPTVNLKLIYQRVGPADIVYVADTSVLNVQIPRIPDEWHRPAILNLAKLLRKMDKGADNADFQAAVATTIKQMQSQEPHGREKPARRPIHPAWRTSPRY